MRIIQVSRGYPTPLGIIFVIATSDKRSLHAIRSRSNNNNVLRVYTIKKYDDWSNTNALLQKLKQAEDLHILETDIVY